MGRCRRPGRRERRGPRPPGAVPCPCWRLQGNFYYGWGTAAERQQARGQLLFELNRKTKSIGPLSDEQGTRQYAGAHSDNAAATWLVADRDGDHELKAAVEQWFKTWAAYMALHLVPHRRTWLPLTAGPRQGKAIPGQEEPCFGTGSTATSLISQQVVLLGRRPPRMASLRDLAAVYRPEPGSEALRGFGGGLTAASLAPEELAPASTPSASEAARRAWAAEGARAFRELAAGRQTWPNLLGHLFRRLRAFGQPRTVTAETLEAAAAVLDAVAAGSSLIDEQVRDALLDALRG